MERLRLNPDPKNATFTAKSVVNCLVIANLVQKPQNDAESGTSQRKTDNAKAPRGEVARGLYPDPRLAVLRLGTLAVNPIMGKEKTPLGLPAGF
jgi:hypothetical protein